MMKRNILAVVIPALLAAGAANAAEVYNKDGNKLDLYGKVDARHQFSDNSGDDGDKSYARLGFKGETQINDQMTGYGQWEYNFQLNNPESSTDAAQSGNKTRLGFAGLKFGDAGSIDYGRNYGVVYDAIGWTDMLPVFGGDSGNPDNFMNGRSTGLLTYRNSNFFGLVDGWNFAVQYQGKNENSNRNGQTANGDGWGVSSSYTAPIGVGIVGAYSSSDRTDAQAQGVVANGNVVGAGKHAESWATALKYDANNVYLAAMYGEMRNAAPISIVTGPTTTAAAFANKAQIIEMVAQYQFDFGLRPSLAYVQSKGKDIEGIGDADLYKYFDVGATYYFNKNMATYVDYKINQLDKNNPLGIPNDDVVGVGLVYQF
ncbi:porin OmpC [Pantoea ananatis]|uniref:Outer membrane protein F OmpF n=4 Tax=Pantoea ananas TaxID=553 RepID=A0A0H3KUA6_PANAA|nr:porin OmpC [Pantoea ananatis]MDC7863970.1 porin OmpC [Pantoea ananatis]MDQ1225253.1 outer membrane pore protein F [Pantoea ananatis]MDR6089765.1 outer membrane pore protein F [Pantoea ananatis]PWV67282.1 outer membrane pore protein F [Pantoea ananatis]BAK10773.1 outer membrane protein F precursor OmpF [Pantoea ananatis AJ13355]